MTDPKKSPNSDTLFEAARQAIARSDHDEAASLLEQAIRVEPAKPRNTVALSNVLMTTGRHREAAGVLERLLRQNPHAPDAWLTLASIRDALGLQGGLAACYQAVSRAQKQGRWISQSTTPPYLLDKVINAVERLRSNRKELFLGAFATIRDKYGRDALTRVEHTVSVYLQECDGMPISAHQRPRFLFFPGLNDQPFLDPYSHAWANDLVDSFDDIRQEALSVVAEAGTLQKFIELKSGDNESQYLSKADKNSAWDAYFFYRHGSRFDLNHDHCPRTSKVLESIPLCRVEHQAPEICFSLLKAGTHILPHFGVTNIRSVMHMPLVTPPDCALNILGYPPHTWRERELVLFDDTFEHEAWNRSSEDRLILLMDCWNPNLSIPEREAVAMLVEVISGLAPPDRNEPMLPR